MIDSVSKRAFTISHHNCNITDIDECDKGIHECSENAECHDTDGSYWCECWSGFMGDGFNCTGQTDRIDDKTQC